jgi:hypothetical protein
MFHGFSIVIIVSYESNNKYNTEPSLLDKVIC